MAFVSAAAAAGLGLRAPAVAGPALGVAARRMRLVPLPASRVRMTSSATPKDDKDEGESPGGGLEATPRGNARAYRRGRGGSRGWRTAPSLWGLSAMRPDLLAGELAGAFDSPFFRASGGLFAGGWPSASMGADWAPRADLTVSADGKGYEWAVELPGMSKDDVKLSIDGDILTVRGEKRSERETVGGGTERLWGTFSRSIVAPADADLDKSGVKAIAKDGVLTVSFPKTSPQEEEQTDKEDNTIPIMGE